MRSFVNSFFCDRQRGYLLCVATLVFTASCNSILDSKEDELARDVQVLVTGQTQLPLLLVTSTAWEYLTDPLTGERVLQVYEADTAALSLPFDQTFPFTESFRFLARVVNPDSTQAATIRLRLVLKQQTVCDETASLRNASFQCTWRYRF